MLKRKYTFRRDSNPRSVDYEANSLPLSCLTRWWTGIKVAYINFKSQIVGLQNNTPLSKMTIVNNFEQNGRLCKKSSNIYVTTLASTECLYDKNVTKTSQQEFWVFFFSENGLKFCDVRLLLLNWKETKLIVSINSRILLCLCWGYTYEKSSTSVQWLFVKSLRSGKRYLRSENSKLD